MAKVFQPLMRGLRAGVLALGALTALALPLQAQDDGFGPAVIVNDRVITRFELDQRMKMMQVFRQPGDIPKLALQSLVDDALRRQAAKAADVTASPEAVKGGMVEFAARANLPIEKFLEELGKAGVAPETLRDFVEAGLLWRDVVRGKFSDRLKITDAEIDRAIGAGAASGGELRLLLSEIVLPMGEGSDAMALAQRLRLTATTSKAFSMAAQDYSQAPTARAGGQLGWINASALPPELAPAILALKVDEMTDPIVMGQTVQMFYLRDLSQSGGEAKGASEVDYARFFAPAGMDMAALAATLDTCDDIYDLARGLPAEAVQRATLAEAGLTADLRAAVARLDPGETTILPGPGGTAQLVMLCRRAPMSEVAPSRDDVANTLLNAKFGLMATAYLEELRSNAFIRIQ